MNKDLRIAETKLDSFMKTYQKLTEDEKFILAKTFNKKTGGKLSPYNSPEPVALTLLPVHDPVTGEFFIVAGRRTIEPGYGLIALPGGYVEHHEQPNVAGAREMFEETGIQLDPNKLVPIFSPRTSKSNCTILFMLYTESFPFTVEQLNQILIESQSTETSEMALIKNGTKLAFPAHEEVVTHFFDNFAVYSKYIKKMNIYIPHNEIFQKPE